MSGIEQFADQSYLSLQTYRKNGEAMPTPVWFVQDGEKFYIRTIAGSGKVKRINSNPKVQIMPCGQSGEPLGTWAVAQAREMVDEATFAHAKSLLIAKYGEIVQTLEAEARERGQEYTVLLVEPDKPSETYLQQRAARASREKYEAALAQVPDVEPEAYDRFPES